MVRVTYALRVERELANGVVVVDDYEIEGAVNLRTREVQILAACVYYSDSQGTQCDPTALSADDLRYHPLDLEDIRHELRARADDIACAHCRERAAADPATFCEECLREHVELPASYVQATAATLVRRLDALRKAHPELYRELTAASLEAEKVYDAIASLAARESADGEAA